MTNKQLNAALTMAQDSSIDLSGHDDRGLYGLALQSFQPVIVTIEQLARFVRWQCVCLNGAIDTANLQEIATCGRRKVTVMGQGA